MTETPNPPPPADSRRDFLKRVMRTAGYVPPALVAMGMGNMAAAQATAPAMMMMMMMSDREAKTAVAELDRQAILDRLAGLPLQTWSYTADAAAARHIGPMAQDFKKAFEVGTDERHIHAVDANGVALAAIQGLYALVREQAEQIARLEARLGSPETPGR